MPSPMKVAEFLPEIWDGLIAQLNDDYLRHGDAWLNLPRQGQEMRIYERIVDYFDTYYVDGTPVPWLKIIGNCVIALIREKHPGLFPDGDR